MSHKFLGHKSLYLWERKAVEKKFGGFKGFGISRTIEIKNIRHLEEKIIFSDIFICRRILFVKIRFFIQLSRFFNINEILFFTKFFNHFFF